MIYGSAVLAAVIAYFIGNISPSILTGEGQRDRYTERGERKRRHHQCSEGDGKKGGSHNAGSGYTEGDLLPWCWDMLLAGQHQEPCGVW